MSYARKFVPVAAAVGLLLAAAACGSSSLDNGKNADVILEISRVPPIPPVSTSGSLGAGTCYFTPASAVTMSVKNVPKNELGKASPYNDIVVDTVRVDYAWVGGVLTSTPQLVPVGVTVAANGGTGDIPITPVLIADLTPVTSFAGQTAVLTITLSGHAVEGRPVSAVYTGSVVNINPCQP